MIVALGVDAIANAPLADVIAACQRRGIGAVCLTVTDVVELEQSGAELQRCGIALAAFRFSSIHDIAPARAARSAAALGATMLADTIAEEAWLNGFVAAGGRVAATVE
ncbi:MAG TPA: hypothetical protein VGC44_05230, partial [Longimicrobiales bacterium]